MSKRPMIRGLSKHLRQLAEEVRTITDDGDPVTNGEALARLLWQKALGYREKQVDDEGKVSEVVHKPEAWAIQLVYDRMEGKTPMAQTEESTRVKAAERIRDLAQERLNAMAQSATSPIPRPPKKTDTDG